VDEVTIDDFVENILPNIETMELLVENKYTPNLVSLIAPSIPEPHKIFQWDNPFSWSYSGNTTDSIKANVKSAGGVVDGVLRFSIQWNDKRNDKSNDLDAHCMEPNNPEIYYGNKRNASTGGNLDVDIMSPGSKTAVENITWPDLSKMKDGKYKFRVKNYSGVNTDGFSAEIEFNGEIHSFSYEQSVRCKGFIEVADVTLKDGKFTIKPILPSSMSSKDVWGIETEKFQKVSTMMLSPNFWDDQKSGNKHYFFMLENCHNPDDARGIYNEFLRSDLTEHRKVFEMLGDKIKCKASEHQLSGLGFSSTKHDEVVCKVTGNFTRTLKIKF